ncbi:hypothetical protein RCL1_001855 [Eukaryota sp. TZLM3-RCL]
MSNSYDNLFRFSSFCDKVLENLALSSKKKDRERVVSAFWDHLRKNGVSDFWPFNRLLLCSLDNERRVFKLQEKKLAARYVASLGLTKSSPLGDALIHYRQPSRLHSAAGDFPEVLYHCLKPRQSSSPTSMSISEINSVLDLLPSMDQFSQENLFRELLSKLSALEHKWLCRIILKDLKIRMSSESILKLWHSQAVQYLNITNSLRKVMTDLIDQSVTIQLFQVALNVPVKPMLAKRCSSSDVYNKFFPPGTILAVEPKLDGERLQVHVSQDNQSVRCFSRMNIENLKFNDDFNSDMLSCLDCNSAVLDGEVLVFNKNTQKFDHFGGVRSLATVGSNDQLQLCFVAFDLLFLDGRSLIDLSYSTRRSKLRSALLPVRGRIELITITEVSNSETLVAAYNTLISTGEEGAIIKVVDSPYTPSLSKASREIDWMKLKPDYDSNGVGDIDLVCVAGKFGNSSRSQDIASLHLAVYDSVNDKWILLCRAGGGLSDQMRVQLTTEITSPDSSFSRMSTSDIPNSSLINFGSGLSLEDRPDFVLENVNRTFIVTVSASQISKSKVYPLGWTLRFPRVTAIRLSSEKDVYECATVDSFNELIHSSAHLGGRLYTSSTQSSQLLDSSDLVSTFDDDSLLLQDDGEDTITSSIFKRKKKTSVTKKKPPKVRLSKYDQVRNAMVRRLNITVETQLFAGLEFYIECKSIKYSNLWTTLLSNGANVVENPTSSLQYVIIDHDISEGSPRIKTLAQERNDIDFVLPDWIELCLVGNEVLPISPVFLIQASSSTDESIANHFDCFGDSFTHNLTEEHLKKVFIKGFSPQQILNCQESLQFKESLMELESQFESVKFFTGVLALFLHPHISLEFLIEFHGGSVVNSLKQCTHVIVDPSMIDRHHETLSEARNRKTEFGSLLPPSIVSLEWIRSCVHEKTRLYEGLFGIQV